MTLRPQLGANLPANDTLKPGYRKSFSLINPLLNTDARGPAARAG